MKENQKHKFKTPEGYFENFNERLMARLEEENEGQSEIIPKTDGFAVPEGYFDSLNANDFNDSKNSDVKVISLKSYRTFYYAAAAIAVIFILVFAWTNNQQSIEFDDLANNDITDYLEDHDFDLTSYEIAELLPVENIMISDITEEPIEEENILQYLDENIDLDDVEDLNLDYDELE